MALVNNGKADFTQDHCDRYRDHCNEIFQGFNVAYSMGKWGFIAKELVGPVDERSPRGAPSVSGLRITLGSLPCDI